LDRREILIERAKKSFRTAFLWEPDLLVAAPGRVNLIGEHTDYNDGFVLPCAIDYETVVAISAGKEGRICAVAGDYEGAQDSFIAANAFEHQVTEWTNHVRGVIAAMGTRGLPPMCADIAIAGNVPQGAGLSSSASMSVAMVKGLASLYGLSNIDAIETAKIAQQSENDFVGTACGIMDQLISAGGQTGTAMLLDCRSLEPKYVQMPDGLEVMVVHSGIARGLVDSAYNERRMQCEQVAAYFGIQALRDLTYDQLLGSQDKFSEVSFRRARHVVTENSRTLAAADALADNDINTLSELMRQSHASMRDDFEITLPLIDSLVEMIGEVLGSTGGVRMTGGGFGGCVVALVPVHMVSHVTNIVETRYRDPNGNIPQIFMCKPSAGASVL
jgi:galactokinase